MEELGNFIGLLLASGPERPVEWLPSPLGVDILQAAKKWVVQVFVSAVRYSLLVGVR